MRSPPPRCVQHEMHQQAHVSQVDEWVDVALAIAAKPKDVPTSVNATLGRVCPLTVHLPCDPDRLAAVLYSHAAQSKYLTGDNITLADAVVWGYLTAYTKAPSGNTKVCIVALHPCA